MLQFIKKKIRSQRLLNGCLFFGIMILVAVLSLIPMFEKGALDDVILYDFEDMALEMNQYPAVISRSEKLEPEEAASLSDVDAVIKGYTDRWNKYIDLPVLSRQVIYTVTAGRMSANLVAKEKAINIVAVDDENEEHLELKDSENGLTNDAFAIKAYVKKSTMDDLSLTVGETLEFEYLKDENGNHLSVVISGVAEAKDTGDYFWFDGTRGIGSVIVVSKEDLEKIIQNYDAGGVEYKVSEVLDYRGITSNNIRAIYDYIKQFEKNEKKYKSSFTDLLANYFETQKMVKVVIISILTPLLVLLLIFIYMVSDRLRTYEEPEINVLRSRGISRKTIIRQYLTQFFLIITATLPIGVLLGFLMCKLGASSVDFLTFSIRNTDVYTFRFEVLAYMLIAYPVAGLLMILPIMSASKNTVLSNKGKKHSSKKNFVERYFLDIIILAIAVYLLYNYTKQRDVMVTDIMSGKSVDPMILIDAELFTFGAAFLLIRLTRLTITAIYKMGKKKWKPETLAAFLEVIKTRRKSWVISVFLIITIAMGIYSANLAKTVNANKRERLVNDIGTDCIMTPLSRVVASGNEREAWTVSTPEYSSILKLKEDGLATEMTRVYRTEKLNVQTKKGKIKDAMLLGVDTMGVGKSSTFDIMNNDHHWFNDLNALASVSNGAIISKNMADDYGVKVGDTLELKLESAFADDAVNVYAMSVQVVGVLDTFPSFNRYFYTDNVTGTKDENERYLVVINEAEMKLGYGELPPEVWMKLADGVTVSDIQDCMDKEGVLVQSIVGLDEEIDKTFGSAMLLITNGLFNISFIISMIICVIGFLIYWLTSIYSRQLYFGVYRAMGMGMKRINKMLVKEHILSTMTSLVSSVLVGVLTSVLFTRIISCIYLPEKHSIPLKVFISYQGFIRIAVVMIIAIAVCMIIIRRFIKSLNITEAIKLGED